MGKTCNKYGGEQSQIKGFGGETREKETACKTQA